MCIASLPCRGSNQGGAALIMALLVTAIVAVLGVQFGEAFALNLARAENRWHGTQARNYLLATETLAGHFLEEDLINSEADSLDEPWAMPVTLPTDHGLLEVELEDAQGRLNLNTLARPWSVPDNKPNPQPFERFSPAQRRFIRLLQIFEEPQLTQQEAIAITEAVIDWVDDDGENLAGFGGAETLYYNNLEPSYKPANQPFDSVSELQMVKGITAELFEKLQPLVVALPEEETVFNVNTAPPILLRTINNRQELMPLPEQDVNSMIEERQLQPFETIDDYFNNPQIQGLVPDPATTGAGYGVASDYFILHAKASVGDQIRYVTSYLHRTDDAVTTIKRRYTSY